jgi:hypothetical protein
LVTAWLAYLGYRKSRGLAVPIILALTALAAPVWFFFVRDRF